ncbi:MAG: TetR/AcrR family transcriptional regulator [Terrimicrobiaceae bacterium]
MSEAKQRILETAGKLFAGRGYELVGINEIIEKSGVAKATFYQHFRSKEALCLEWLKGVAEWSEKESLALLDQELDPREKIAAKFDKLHVFLKSSDYRGCPFSNTAVVMLDDNSVRALVDQYKASCRLFWHSLALQVRREPAGARALGDALFLLFSGAVTESQNSRAGWPVESAKAAALTLCGKTT